MVTQRSVLPNAPTFAWGYDQYNAHIREVPPTTSPLFLPTPLPKSIIVYILSIVIENIPKDRFPNVQQLKYGYNYRFPVKQGYNAHTFTSAPSHAPTERQERHTKEGIKQGHKDQVRRW